MRSYVIRRSVGRKKLAPLPLLDGFAFRFLLFPFDLMLDLPTISFGVTLLTVLFHAVCEGRITCKRH